MTAPTEETFVQRPSTGMRVLVWVAAVVTLGVAIGLLLSEQAVMWRLAASILATVAVAGAVDASMSRVELGSDDLVIRTLLRRERVLLAYARRVSTDGGGTALQMEDGAWVKLPDWVGSGRGLRNRIVARLDHD